MRVIGLSGSLRPHSHTRRAVETALTGAAAAGARVELLDLREFELPFCPGSASALASQSGTWRTNYERCHSTGRTRRSSGSPEYHGSFSGVLKNALDVTELEDWQGKLISLIGISGGSMGPLGALAGLRDVGPRIARLGVAAAGRDCGRQEVFDEHGQPQDELRDRLLRFGRLTVEALHGPFRHS